MIAELQQVVALYAHSLDELDVAGLEAVLTEDTAWTFLAPEQGTLGPVTGRAAVLDFVRAGHAAQTGRVRHNLGNLLVQSMNTESAVVKASLVQTRNTGDSVQLISTGVYTLGLRQTGGSWRIAELTLSLDNPPV